ncbi:branched-chain amino acid ABC transporter permease [Kribbella sandramycini]|uniref:Branched-chain amino acid ABC transporter permease n=1 Tax=Kribbella sandramycini TaxID=60450 RepID=A0A7Y4KUD6_9ACTN|nr:branched-chain amino acid ABC transporter permease [Kribbella sandramycini]MBB6568612.1 branched-chain amino acid transport system permease protein [Kribbella sandramycini]NOL38803.1 branched-chain amino acid ABC transporter permease [Kribbella sandramycini]
MSEFLATIVRGLGSGSIYALLALGFVIVYKSMRVISFAQPAFMMAGSLLVGYLVLSMNFFLAVLLALLLTALLGAGVERLALRPMIGKPVFVLAIVTLGVDIVIRTVVNSFIGLDIRQMGDPWGLQQVDVLGVQVDQRHLATLLTTLIVVAALFAFYRWSRTGLAMRAASSDQEVALAQGISVARVFSLSWALAAALAGLAGVFLATGIGLEQNLWLTALKALPVIILGGLDSLGGAVLAGLAIGVVEAVVGSYGATLHPIFGGDFFLVVPYLLMLLVLLVRPYGLFGTREVERI